MHKRLRQTCSKEERFGKCCRTLNKKAFVQMMRQSLLRFLNSFDAVAHQRRKASSAMDLSLLHEEKHAECGFAILDLGKLRLACDVDGFIFNVLPRNCDSLGRLVCG